MLCVKNYSKRNVKSNIEYCEISDSKIFGEREVCVSKCYVV